MKKHLITEYHILKEYFEKIKNLLQDKPTNGENHSILLGRVTGLLICCDMEIEHLKHLNKKRS